jgi:cobalt-zinc-cadmium efflux system outer membrane protein
MRSVFAQSLFLVSTLALITSGALSSAQSESSSSLSEEEAIRLVLEKSPDMTAVVRRLDAATAQLRGAKSPYNTQVELAPGVGFTNSNAFLSQRLDLGGKRSAESRRASGERAAAAATLEITRHQVITEARLAYYDLLRAQANLTSAEEAVQTARQIRDTVKKRVEIGETPPVQQARAEIELNRMEQEAVRAQGDLKARQASLNLLLGRSPSTPLTLFGAMTTPPAPQSSSLLVQRALQSRPELTFIKALIEAKRGEVDIARAAGRPDLYTDVVGDIWSMDRASSLQNRNRTTGTLGFQVRLGFPLWDRGSLRADVDRAKASVQAEEAEGESLRRRLTIEVERTTAELSSARAVVLNYQQSILPQSVDLLKAVRSGFESGITSFLEVLEAQRVLRQTQVEYQNALYEATRAMVNLDKAIGVLPGTLASQRH